MRIGSRLLKTKVKERRTTTKHACIDGGSRNCTASSPHPHDPTRRADTHVPKGVFTLRRDRLDRDKEDDEREERRILDDTRDVRARSIVGVLFQPTGGGVGRGFHDKKGEFRVGLEVQLIFYSFILEIGQP